MNGDTLDLAAYLDAVHAIVVDVDHDKLRRIEEILETGEIADDQVAATTSDNPNTWNPETWGSTEEAQQGMAAALALTGET